MALPYLLIKLVTFQKTRTQTIFHSLRSRESGIGCRVSGVGCRVSGVGCRVSGVGCRVSGVGVRRKFTLPRQ
ncbi:MAG: hypothetical protein F6K38_38960 [Moorea sp. SIO3B2]|nr:hypothetical protein [Moorena sp. SIO3B2]